MKKILCLAALLALTIPHSSGQTTLPHVATFDPTMPPAGWKIFRKGASDPFHKWDIGTVNGFDGSSLFHNYPVGGSAVTDDWYVSLPFSFTTGGKIDSLRHAFSGFGLPQAGDTVAIYLLQGNADPALATQTLLYDFRGANYVADNLWKKTTNISIPPTAGTSYIAFRYNTVANWLDVRFDNLGLSGNAVNGIADAYQPGTDFIIAPNPVVNSMAIHTTTPFDRIRIYDALGRTVYSHSFVPSVDLSALCPGTYFLELTDASQKKAYTSIQKQ